VATKIERKKKAVEIMTKMRIYKPYINAFDRKDCVCFFEGFAGFWAYQEPHLQEKIQEIEIRHNCTVYAVTHEFTEFGECYSLLLVTAHKKEWIDLHLLEENIHYAFAFVWNKDDEWCSEFGTIGVRSFGGGISRVF